jgi:hypothetical protein
LLRCTNLSSLVAFRYRPAGKKGVAMFGLSFWHIAILVVIAFLLFGGRLSDLMGAAGKSLRKEDGLAPMIGNQFLPPVLQRILKMFIK